MQTPQDRIPQLDAMRAGVAFKFACKTRSFSVTLRPLTLDEQVNLINEVQADLSSMDELARNRITEETLYAKRTLAKASTTDVDTNDPKLTDYVLGKMIISELLFMYKQYLQGVERCNPAMEEMGKAEVDALIEECKKKPSQVIDLPILQLLNMVRVLLTKDG